MNKKQFLSTLTSSLQNISSSERHDILQDFEEHFAIGLKEGKTEEQISKLLGDPYQIGKEILTSYSIDKMDSHVSSGNIIRTIWIIIGLGFFNLIVVLAPFITLISIIISLWITSVLFICSPILILINTILHPEIFEFFHLYLSITLCGLGILLFIGTQFINRITLRYSMKYIAYNIHFIKKGRKHD